MARGQTNKLYRTFNKGLVTEAGYLTYPEDASTDELNTVIKRKGSRSRRLGLDYEPSSTADTYTSAQLDATKLVSEYHWRSVGNDADLNFLVVQIGSTLFFYNTASTPLSSGRKAFTVNLLTYKSPTATDAQVAGAPCHMVGGKGYLFVANEFIEPLTVEYNSTGDTITVTKIIIQVRDFDGVDDDLANDQEPSTLSKEHYYNLKNQGWVKPGQLGVIEGTGSTNPHTAPAAPTDSGTYGSYDPYSGTERTVTP